MNSFKILAYELSHDMALLELSGDVTSESVPKLEKALVDQSRGYRFLLLDMTRVTAVDPRGAACLMDGYVLASSQGKWIRLWSLPPRVREILLLVKLLTVFGPTVHDLPKAA